MVASSEWRVASSDSPLFAIRYSPFASDRSSDVSRFDEGGSPPSSGVGGGHGNRIGEVDSSGVVYDFYGNRVGEVDSSGIISDFWGNCVGYAEPPDVTAGGAAFLLLIRS